MKHATKRLLSFAIALVLVLGALLIFFNLVQPAYVESQTLKAEKISKENFFKNQEETIKQVEEVIAAYRGDGNPQALADLAVPKKKDEANIVNQISVLAAKHQLAVQSITISTPGAKTTTAKQRANATSTKALVKPIGVLTVQLRASGSYANFRSFLQNLETNIRIMDMTALALSPVGKSSQDFYTYDLTVASYYQNP